MPSTASSPRTVSHNLLGQRLGAKGRGTRERILAAADRLLAGPGESTVSLSAVAREASLAMTTLYLYFGDLTELLLAVLEPIMASARGSYGDHLAERWPDAELATHCDRFVRAYHGFWERHTRILHLRNMLADGRDERMVTHRIAVSRPIIELLLEQMRAAGSGRTYADVRDMASVLMTGIERVVTITTDDYIANLPYEDPAPGVEGRLRMQARLLELAIRDCRATG
jgi:AcrR family transcriptional regulator